MLLIETLLRKTLVEIHLRHFYRHSLLAFFGAAEILSDSFISERLVSQMYCRL